MKTACSGGPRQPPRTLEALKEYQRVYREGLLDLEFYNYNRYEGAQKFYVQGTSGIALEDGHAMMITYIRNGLGAQRLDPDKALHLAQLVGEDGKYHYREDANYWGEVLFSPDISGEKFERAMDILHEWTKLLEHRQLGICDKLD